MPPLLSWRGVPLWRDDEAIQPFQKAQGPEPIAGLDRHARQCRARDDKATGRAPSIPTRVVGFSGQQPPFVADSTEHFLPERVILRLREQIAGDLGDDPR